MSKGVGRDSDALIVGGGAAGLAAAVFAASLQPGRRIQVLCSSRVVGAKLLLSGGGRCNLTHRVVSETDFNGAPPPLVRRVLRAFPVDRTLDFFREIGVGTREERDGRVLAASERSRDVRDALAAAASARGVQLATAARVVGIARRAEGFAATTAQGAIYTAPRILLATGGRSYPQTGSDGSGYALAEALGHSIVTPTPALVPLVLEGSFHRRLSGVSHSAALRLRSASGRALRLAGALLWTHFGVSGPVVLNASRHWLRARSEGRSEPLSLAFCPDEDVASLERRLLAIATGRPRASLATVLAEVLPRAVVGALLAEVQVAGARPISQLPREARRALLRALTDWPLRVRASRGWETAEVTAGGVPLGEVDCATMASRRCDGLYLAGEILDVDGRVGGFNLQWAWSSACVAARGLAGAWAAET